MLLYALNLESGVHAAGYRAQVLEDMSNAQAKTE